MDAGPPVQDVQCLNERSSIQLCDLPDKILWHVLSFLHLEDVVRMSILSKRWEDLSRNNPKLCISERVLPGRMHFVNFVNESLFLRDVPLKDFRIVCDTVSDRRRIHTWITAAVKGGVEKLEVRLYAQLHEDVLPSCVFNWETLTEFHLFMWYELRLPSSICLRYLKVLTLAYVDFGGDSSVEKRLSCPSLEELCLISCKWGKLKVLHISAPKLLRLTHLDSHGDLESTFYLGIHQARMESFTYRGRFIHRCIMPSSSCPVVACIGIWFDYPHNAYHGHKLLKKLSRVERLTLEHMEKFSYERSDLLKSLPVFSNLSELKIDAFDPLLSESRFYVVMLHKCPNLSHLVFTSIRAEPETVDAVFNPVPHCFLSSLKVIKIRAFEVRDEDVLAKSLLAVRYLLRTAQVLEKLFIYPRPQRLAGNLLQLLNELPKASDQCEILFQV